MKYKATFWGLIIGLILTIFGWWITHADILNLNRPLNLWKDLGTAISVGYTTLAPYLFLPLLCLLVGFLIDRHSNKSAS